RVLYGSLAACFLGNRNYDGHIHRARLSWIFAAKGNPKNGDGLRKLCFEPRHSPVCLFYHSRVCLRDDGYNPAKSRNPGFIALPVILPPSFLSNLRAFFFG